MTDKYWYGSNGFSIEVAILELKDISNTPDSYILSTYKRAYANNFQISVV